MTKQELRSEELRLLETAPLFFPITPFDADGAVSLRVFERHLAAGLQHEPGAVFVGCGAGEFHAMSEDEIAQITHHAVRITDGRRPIFVGAGGSLPIAQAICKRAALLGAQGILLMPPYLVTAPQSGLVEYVRQVALASPIPIVVYARANMNLSIDSAVAVSRLDNVIGFKDGIGNVERMQRIVTLIRKEGRSQFLFMNGLPTAEVSAYAYRGIGVPIYSSAAFAFVPEIAIAFWQGLREGNADAIDRLLFEFYLPLVALRDETPGFAVALIKAGLALRGRNAGSVRPPLSDPSPAQVARLEALIERGLGVAKQLKESKS